MPRFALTLVFCAWVAYGAGIIGAGALAANSALSRCLDASTILGAGGDVSDQELTAAQSACMGLKQSPPDKNTLARVNAALDTIVREVKRRQAAGR
jgi:hypothetical protein